MKAPFPYFGGKRRVAPWVWEAMGDVDNYVEPFAGSLAVLLERPSTHVKRAETVNDKDSLLANFWRALAADPDAVAHHCDWPVNECVPAGTAIATPTGSRPIESLSAGDEVWGFDECGTVVRSVVIATTSSDVSTDELVVVGPLTLTKNHPVWTTKGYVPAGDLVAGEKVGMVICADGPEAQEPESYMRVLRASLRHEDVDPGSALHEPRGSERLGRSGSEGGGSCRVYNIQTDVGNYFAEGTLVHNCDLFARHLWLVNEGLTTLRDGMEADPNFYDAKIAGWWVWGINAWIGSGWCSGTGPWIADDDRKLPHLGDAGRGVNRQLPHLGDAGRGVNGPADDSFMLHGGSGAPSASWDHSLRHDGEAPVYGYMRALAARLRRVRVCCGDWSRVVTKGALTYGSTVGVFLDPPYSGDVRTKDLYATEGHDVAAEVRDWAVAHGDDTRLRIVLAGYEAEHEAHMPASWRRIVYSASKAYGTSSGGGVNAANRHKERLWLSPGCLRPRPSLFDDAGSLAEVR